MTSRSIAVAMLSLALAACVAPGSGPESVLPVPPDLKVTVTPAQGADPEPDAQASVPSAPSEGGEVVPGEFLVGLGPEADAQQIAQAVGATLEGEIRFSGRYAHLALPSELTLLEAQARLEAQQGVMSVAPNWRVQPSYLTSSQSPGDVRYADQWAHQVTSALPAWRALGTDFSAANVAIAVLDTGVDVGHPDFGGRVLAGRNFTSEHPDPSRSLDDDVTDIHGHGTHVAGIAAASGHNAQGVAGVAWDARIVPVKVLARTGGTAAGILQGIRFAADYPATEASVRVINMSLGIVGRFTTEAAFEDAMGYAWRKGVAVVVAAGNDASDVTRPGTNPHAVVVSATAVYEPVPRLWVEFLAGFSNRGDRIDVSAPGDDILSTVPRNANLISDRHGLLTRPVGDETSLIDEPYAYDSGTSMSAPYVAGLAALLVARYDPYHLRANGAFADRLVERLEATSDDLGPPGKDPYFGYGRVNVQRALAPASL